MLIGNAISCAVEKASRHNLVQLVLTSYSLSSTTYYIFAVTPNLIRCQSMQLAGRRMKTFQIVLFIVAVGLLLLVGKHAAT